MDVDFNETNATAFLADLVNCENTEANIKKLINSINAKEAVNTNLFPIGKIIIII